MERKADKNFILAVTFILAATLLSAQMIKEPTGLATQPTQPTTQGNFGSCFQSEQSPNPRQTTYINCCETTQTFNNRWVKDDKVFYC